MSTSVTTSFVKQYEREVHDVFQRTGSFLYQTVRQKSNVKGSTTTFQVIGTGVATTKARHGTITPMNQSHTAMECTLSDFYAGDWVDKLDEFKVGHDERESIARGGAWALGRKVDDQILTAADTTTTTAVVSTGAITRALLLQAVEALDDNDVPRDGNRFALLTPRAWSQAMTITEFASSDFIGGTDLPYLKGAEPRTWLGVHWMQHTGLSGKGTTTAKNLVYHRQALGYGSQALAGIEGRMVGADITWHGDRAAHFVNHMMSGGACLIESGGVVEMHSNDTAAIPT